ncbi:MAG: hypothetical protein NTY38_26485 [Acidobacteria bacterium]|nr:hypothetical protein [Acidobacteriota bacterium]
MLIATDEKKNCRYCYEKIREKASVCSHCQKHQHRGVELAYVLAQMATVFSATVALAYLVATVWQYTQATSALEMATLAKTRAEAAQVNAANTARRLSDLVALAEEDRRRIAVVATSLPKTYRRVVLVDFGVVLDSFCIEDREISLPGVLPGDTVNVGWPGNLPGGLYGSARVQRRDTVSVRGCSMAGNAVTLNQQRIAVQVIR